MDVIKRERLDAKTIYRQMEEKGHSTDVKLCCGRSRKRRDFPTMLRQLGYKGHYLIIDNNVIVAVVDLPDVK